LVQSSYEEVMLVDVDTVWFQNPEYLFNVPGYQSTGALFFRDRHLFESPGCGLNYSQVTRFIESRMQIPSINVSEALRLEDSTSWLRTAEPPPHAYRYSYYWRHAINSSRYRPLCHAQESSVVIIHKGKLPKTINLIRSWLPDFRLGYGDKELYWLAATVAREPHAWEPYLAGAYGDCGEIVHFDPRYPSAEGSEALPYFMNGQFLAEDVREVGKGLSAVISSPVLALRDAGDFELGPFNKSTSGRCGACEHMGCSPAPPGVTEAIVRMQSYQHAHAKPLRGVSKEWYYLLRRIKSHF